MADNETVFECGIPWAWGIAMHELNQKINLIWLPPKWRQEQEHVPSCIFWVEYLSKNRPLLPPANKKTSTVMNEIHHDSLFDLKKSETSKKSRPSTSPNKMEIPLSKFPLSLPRLFLLRFLLGLELEKIWGNVMEFNRSIFHDQATQNSLNWKNEQRRN